MRRRTYERTYAQNLESLIKACPSWVRQITSIWDTLNLLVCLDTMYGCYVPLPPLILFFGNVCNFFCVALVGPFWIFKALFKIFSFVSWANVPFLTRANVPFFGQKCQKSWRKCVIFRANVPFLTGANVLRASDT